MNKVLAREELVAKSASLAEKWHDGQQHTFGSDSYYAMHLKPVAEIARRLGYGSYYVATAYLHDIKEDTAITDKELLSEGIPKEVIKAVNLLSKKANQSQQEYLAGILTSQLATVVKYCDSSFNFSNTILNSAHLAREDFERRSAKYSQNISILFPNIIEKGSKEK